MNDKELISKMRELADRVFHGDSKPSDFRIIDRATDALEARQSSGDTCEDDREALVRVVANHPIAPLMRLGGDAGYPLADAILAAGFSRAAVPNAATEELERAHDLIDLREFEIDNLHELISELRTERDAALAVLERVRAIAERHGMKPWTEEIFAALDEAPEPEVKP